MLEASAFVTPFAEAERAIAKAPAEIVLVDTDGMAFSTDLVRNDPFLRNRPLLMDLRRLNVSQVETLCATHTVALFDRHDGAPFHFIVSEVFADAPARIALRTSGCDRTHVLGARGEFSRR